MQDPPAAQPLRRAGYFFPVDAYVVAPGELRPDAQRLQRTADRPCQDLHAQLRGVLRVRDEGIVQVPQVVIHRSAARHPPHHADAVPPDKGRIDLLRGVLVQADDDRIRVLPEQQPVALPAVFQHKLLKGKVIPRVRAPCLQIVQRHEKPPSQYLRKV